MPVLVQVLEIETKNRDKFETDKSDILTDKYHKKNVFPPFTGHTNTTFKMVKYEIPDKQKPFIA